MYSGNVTDFLADTETTMAGVLEPQPAELLVRAFGQIAYISPEVLSIYPTRLQTNRGNGYNPPGQIGWGVGPPDALAQQTRNFSHDCDNTGSGQVTLAPPSSRRRAPGSPARCFRSGIPGISREPVLRGRASVPRRVRRHERSPGFR